MSNEAIIAMLQADMRDEHAAIVQYLRHAYALGEGEVACEIESIAREEMRHFDWLADAIVDLGGDPTMVRGQVFIGDTRVDNMALDVEAEDRAIAQYKEHIAKIEDPKIKRLLRRILADEEAHRGDFAHFKEKVEAGEGFEAPEEGEAEEPNQRTLEILNQGVRHEYTVTLQYLYHTFVMPECEISRELEMQTINEMQHLGWLAEEIEEMGGTPDIEHTELNLAGDTAAMLRADIEAEREVIKDYNSQIAELSDEELKELLARIRDHEIYHDELFSDMLEEVEAAKEEKTEAPAKTEPEEERKPSPSLGEWTVGSLIKSQ